MADTPSAPRKQPSGAQKRKAKRDKDAAASVQANRNPKFMAPQSSDSSGSWMSSSEYQGTASQWDPNAPPYELPLYGQPPQTLVKAVAATLLQLEQGAFWSASYLWDGMTRDDRLWAILNVRIDRLLGSPMSIKPCVEYDEDDKKKEDAAEEEKAEVSKGDGPDGDELPGQGEDEEAIDPDVAAAAAKAFDRIKSYSLPHHELFNLMRNALGLSVGIAQQLTTRTVKSSTPTLRVWNNRYLRWDWLLRKYRLITENRGEITVEAGDPEWIVYEPYGPHGWLHGALIRSCCQPWLIRYWVRSWWSRHQEVHGQPIRAGIIPASRDAKDERLFIKQLSNLAHESIIRLPTGQDGNAFDMKLIEAQSDSWQGFKELLDHCDDSLAVLILGQRQSTKGQGGLGTQEDAGESTMMRMTRRDALVGDVIREQMLEPWAEKLFGIREAAPHIVWDVDPPSDDAKIAAGLKDLATALAGFKAAGTPIDVRTLLEEMSLPLLSEEEEEAMKQQAQVDAQQQRDHDMALATAKLGVMGDKKGKDDGSQEEGKRNPAASDGE